MTWPDLYLICFIVGFMLSLISVLAGFFHVPGLHHVHGHDGHAHTGHVHVHGGGAHVSPLNLSTITAFLAWFGGTGYLLTEYSAIWFITALVLSVAIGIVGAALVFWMVAKMMAHERPLDPEDYVHRVGRTARAGASGHAISLACEDYVEGLEPIERYIGFKLPFEVPEDDMLVHPVHHPPRERRPARDGHAAGRTRRRR